MNLQVKLIYAKTVYEQWHRQYNVNIRHKQIRLTAI